MTIRTFRAASVSEALSQVKKELGGAAVILHTRTYKVGGVLGVGAKTITEITATSEMNVGQRLAPKTARAKTPDGSRAAAEVASANSASAASARAVEAAAMAQKAASAFAVPTVAEGRMKSPRAITTGAQALATPAAPVQSSVAGGGMSVRSSVSEVSITTELRDEMAMLRRLVGRVVHSGSAPSPAMPDALQACYLKLIESEVAAEIADEIVTAVQAELPRAAALDAGATRDAVLRRLAAYIPACDTPPDTLERTRDGRPLTIALIGPTGVGKTTTIAKLAATYKLRMGLRVGLVTADTYRIAAVEQLRTYAGIIGLPLRVALTPSEMRSGCEALRECDVVLVDTAGRSPGDAGKLGELGAFLDAAVPHQVHLVLSGASSEACLRHAVASFAAVGPTHLIYTKLDEAVSFGVLVNIARRVNAKLSFVTTGQEVPDHIEAGSAHRLATLVLEGGTVR